MLRPLLFLYNLLLPLLLLASLPRMWRVTRRRGGYGGLLPQRWNRFDPATSQRLQTLAARHPLWLHAVSVGEVNVACKWIDALRRSRPDIPIILSTTTTTGHAVASAQLTGSETCQIIYSPLDLLPVVDGMLRRLRPRALVLVEAEVWPNWVWRAHRRKVPVFLVNARLSPRSRRRYRKLRPLVRTLFSLLRQIHVQEAADAAFWRELGLPPDRIRLCGSVKYDAPDPAEQQRDLEAAARLRNLLKTNGHDTAGPVVLLASTHPGEEQALVTALAPLREEFPALRIWIAPRHVERAPELVRELEATGHTIHRRSRWQQEPPSPSAQPAQSDPSDQPAAPSATSSPNALLLIDTTGELRHWQRLADVVIIGKSFLGRGGQNPAEAVAAGKPVITGPHMDNFAPLMERLEQADGIARLGGLSAVPDQVRAWLREPDRAAAMAHRGAEALAWHHGAAERSVAEVLAALASCTPPPDNSNTP